MPTTTSPSGSPEFVVHTLVASLDLDYDTTNLTSLKLHIDDYLDLNGHVLSDVVSMTRGSIIVVVQGPYHEISEVTIHIDNAEGWNLGGEFGLVPVKQATTTPQPEDAAADAGEASDDSAFIEFMGYSFELMHVAGAALVLIILCLTCILCYCCGQNSSKGDKKSDATIELEEFRRISKFLEDTAPLSDSPRHNNDNFLDLRPQKIAERDHYGDEGGQSLDYDKPDDLRALYSPDSGGDMLTTASGDDLVPFGGSPRVAGESEGHMMTADNNDVLVPYKPQPVTREGPAPSTAHSDDELVPYSMTSGGEQFDITENEKRGPGRSATPSMELYDFYGKTAGGTSMPNQTMPDPDENLLYVKSSHSVPQGLGTEKREPTSQHALAGTEKIEPVSLREVGTEKSTPTSLPKESLKELDIEKREPTSLKESLKPGDLKRGISAMSASADYTKRSSASREIYMEGVYNNPTGANQQKRESRPEGVNAVDKENGTYVLVDQVSTLDENQDDTEKQWPKDI